MATGDAEDFRARLRLALPLRWFPDAAAGGSPVLDGVLSGLAAAWVVVWDNLRFVIAQTRVRTATGEWLDAIAADFLPGHMRRLAGEADDAFRARILAELLRARATRAALAAALGEVTGAAPALFEPVDVRDTGGWGGGGVAAGLFYGARGAALSARPGAGVAGQGGWASAGAVFQVLVDAGVPDAGTRTAAAGVMPCAGIAWLRDGVS